MLGHLQTVMAALFRPPSVSFTRERWDTPDGDFIDVDFAGDAQSQRVMVLFHGLEGCSDSHYARLLSRAFPAAGWRVAIPHWRGCSGEPNRKPRAYHSGDTAEVEWILRKFSAPVDAIGISLGGNALLKWLGERGADAAALVRRAAAVSAPLDLAAAGHALDRGLNRLLYTRMFLSTLKPKSLAQLERFPELFDAAKLRGARTFDSRGVVGKSLTPAIVREIGRALGSLGRERNAPTFAVCRDGRLSGPELVAALTEGITGAGANVIDVGMAPTPIAYFAAHHLNCGSCVAVSGSHNPPQYNGLKMVVAGTTLSGDEIQALRTRAERGDLTSGSGKRSAANVL